MLSDLICTGSADLMSFYSCLIGHALAAGTGTTTPTACYSWSTQRITSVGCHCTVPVVLLCLCAAMGAGSTRKWAYGKRNNQHNIVPYIGNIMHVELLYLRSITATSSPGTSWLPASDCNDCRNFQMNWNQIPQKQSSAPSAITGSH